MSHFDIVHWVDFVRGVAAPELEAGMRTHLADGCLSCDALIRRLDAVAAAARQDTAVEPPVHLVRFALAAFSLHRPERTLSLPALAARLVFGSVGMPAAEGVRGPVEEMNRQTLYEAGDFTIHLKFEQLSGAPRVSLVGQVSNRRVPDPPPAHVPILVTRGRRVVARGLSNEFGEFQMEYEPNEGLELHIPVEDHRRSIRLPLSEPRPE
ncbi:MAG: hypothetical protein ABMA15_00595 [Vicinamibacterales bacterium]